MTLLTSEIWLLSVGVLSLVVWVCRLVLVTMRDDKVKKDGDEGCVVPKGSWGWPLIGETLEFIACGYSSKPVSFMDKRKALYGNVFRTHILGKAIVVSTDPDVNKMILQNHGNVFVPCYPKSITELLGTSSILQMNGSSHKKLHALIGGYLKSPQFKARITRDIENTMRLAMSSWTNNESSCILIQDETKKITFEILVRVLMSVGPGEEMNLLKREFEEFIKGLICLPIKLPGTRLYKSLQAKKRLVKMVRRIIEEKQMGLQVHGKTQEKGYHHDHPNDAIDLLLLNHDDINGGGGGSNYSDETREQQLDHENGYLPLDLISGNIIEMMIPGEETVPTAMTLAVKFLTDNPVALAHLLEENMELKKRKERSGEEYSWTDYISLPFTQNVTSETLRIANIINAVWRKALKDVRFKGYLIPKGWCVLASFSSVHMDETNYENPYEFDPWRWKKTGAAVCSNTFTPFGGGQRLCPGLELSRLEISIFLHHLVTTYRCAAAEKDEIIYFPTVRMKRKLPITIMPL